MSKSFNKYFMGAALGMLKQEDARQQEFLETTHRTLKGIFVQLNAIKDAEDLSNEEVDAISANLNALIEESKIWGGDSKTRMLSELAGNVSRLTGLEADMRAILITSITKNLCFILLSLDDFVPNARNRMVTLLKREDKKI